MHQASRADVGVSWVLMEGGNAWLIFNAPAKRTWQAEAPQNPVSQDIYFSAHWHQEESRCHARLGDNSGGRWFQHGVGPSNER